MGFLFNGKHSETDFDLVLEKKTILPPQKKKIKETVPFMSGSYDFSTLATNGEQVFSERKIEVELAIIADSKLQLQQKYSDILTWLLDTGQQQLIFDDRPDYYYLAEVESAPDFEEVAVLGKLKVNFTAHPFKEGKYLEGDQLWDTFNFETDVLQEVEFAVSGSRAVSVINNGRVTIPVFNASAANMSVIYNTKTYNLVVGDNKFYDLNFPHGTLSMVLNGEGTIKVLFRKESL